MVFYAAMGLPLILDAPVGDHERANAEWIAGVGAARWRPEPHEVADTLGRWLADGTLAACGRRGHEELPRDGTRCIVDAVFNEN
jgi:UDP-N-acetylglucosamine:LPS N-acetylglucosamine transferase